MNKINRKIEYSLIALKHMSQKRPGELTTVKEISDQYQAPFDVTAKVMQRLTGAGFLKAEQGSTGGYHITKDLTKLTLQDLMESFQGPTEIAKCLHANERCEIQSSCNIISPIQNLNTRLNDFYKSVNLSELINKGQG